MRRLFAIRVAAAMAVLLVIGACADATGSAEWKELELRHAAALAEIIEMEQARETLLAELLVESPEEAAARSELLVSIESLEREELRTARALNDARRNLDAAEAELDHVSGLLARLRGGEF